MSLIPIIHRRALPLIVNTVAKSPHAPANLLRHLPKRWGTVEEVHDQGQIENTPNQEERVDQARKEQSVLEKDPVSTVKDRCRELGKASTKHGGGIRSNKEAESDSNSDDSNSDSDGDSDIDSNSDSSDISNPLFDSEDDFGCSDDDEEPIVEDAVDIYLSRCWNAITVLIYEGSTLERLQDLFLSVEAMTTGEYPKGERGDRPEALARYLRLAVGCRTFSSQDLKHRVDTRMDRNKYFKQEMACASTILDTCYCISPRSLIGILLFDAMQLTPTSIGKMTHDDTFVLMSLFMERLSDKAGVLHRLVPQKYHTVKDVFTHQIVPMLE